MNRNALTLSFGLLLSLFSINAAAQVEQVYGDIVTDEASYLEELNAWMTSADARNPRPRMACVLRSVVNGSDPTTHGIILDFADYANWEASMDAAYKSKDFANMSRRAAAFSKGNSETLYLRVADNGKSWNEGDYIFVMSIDVSADEPFIKAVKEYMNSSLGKKAPGALRLLNARAGSDSDYIVAFSAPTFVAGNKFMDEHSGSKDMQDLVAKIGTISKPTSSSIYKVIKVWK
jgi:hypothetical protein